MLCSNQGGAIKVGQATARQTQLERALQTAQKNLASTQEALTEAQGHNRRLSLKLFEFRTRPEYERLIASYQVLSGLFAQANQDNILLKQHKELLIGLLTERDRTIESQKKEIEELSAQLDEETQSTSAVRGKKRKIPKTSSKNARRRIEQIEP